jgi:hypothetical protein
MLRPGPEDEERRLLSLERVVFRRCASLGRR